LETSFPHQTYVFSTPLLQWPLRMMIQLPLYIPEECHDAIRPCDKIRPIEQPKYTGMLFFCLASYSSLACGTLTFFMRFIRSVVPTQRSLIRYVQSWCGWGCWSFYTPR
jgi:hypothetical protein